MDIHTQTDRPLEDRVAVVTGAGSGIGEATARLLAARGARVAVLGRRADRIAAVADDIGGVAVPTDVSDPEQVLAAVDRVTDSLGPADLVVANAGAMLASPFDEADPREWRRMLDVNVMGLLDTARGFLPGLAAAAATGRRADLVLVGSLGAHVVVPDFAVYFATKAAVRHLATNLRSEVGPRGIRVHTVEPGNTSTELGHDMASEPNRLALDAILEAAPPIPAEAVAETIAWATALPPALNVAELLVLPTVQG